MLDACDIAEIRKVAEQSDSPEELKSCINRLLADHDAILHKDKRIFKLINRMEFTLSRIEGNSETVVLLRDMCIAARLALGASE